MERKLKVSNESIHDPFNQLQSQTSWALIATLVPLSLGRGYMFGLLLFLAVTVTVTISLTSSIYQEN